MNTGSNARQNIQTLADDTLFIDRYLDTEEFHAQLLRDFKAAWVSLLPWWKRPIQRVIWQWNQLHEWFFGP